MPLGQPRVAVRTARRMPMLHPCRDHCGCLAHQGVVDHYKGARAVPLERLRFPAAGMLCHRAPLKAPLCFSLRLPSEQMHAPSPCSRPP
jgi:hypothetical protein